MLVFNWAFLVCSAPINLQHHWVTAGQLKMINAQTIAGSAHIRFISQTTNWPTSVRHMKAFCANRGPGYWENWDTLCVSYCIAFLYCIVLSTGFTVKELYYVSILFNYISVFDSPKYWIFIILFYFTLMAETWMRQSLIWLRAKLSLPVQCSP